MDKIIDETVYSCLLKHYSNCNAVFDEGFRGVLGHLMRYQTLIKNWTYRDNLVSPHDVENLWKKHFLPSLKPLELGWIHKSALCLDAGSGAGLPGIPLKIFRPDITIHLCDSNRKKALFLREAVESLSLVNTEVIHRRVEDIEDEYDVVISRAMGKPEEIYEILISRLKKKGSALIWTAKSAKENFPGCDFESNDIEFGGKLLRLTPAR